MESVEKYQQTGSEFNMGYPYKKQHNQIDHKFLPGWEYLEKKI